MDYLVAAVGEWNKSLFEKNTKNLTGNWHFVSTPEDLKNKLFKSLTPRYIFFPHWRWIVPDEIFNQYECICFHMTDVPYGRGGSPLQNLIVRGHQDTVLTALRMEKEVDAGPVYLKKPLSLEGSAADIYNKASKLTWKMIAEIISKQMQPVHQEGEVVKFTRRTPSQSEVPSNLTLEQLYDFIRMLDAPNYPKAFMEYGNYFVEFNNAELLGDELVATVKVKLKGL